MWAKDKLIKQAIDIASVALFLCLFGIFTFLISGYSNYNLAHSKTNPSDFLMYMTGATILKEGNIKNLYKVATQEVTQEKLAKPNELASGLLAFRTPPITALVYLPLTYLKPLTAFYISVGVNFVLLCTIIFLLIRFFTIPTKYLLPSIAISMFFLPVFINTGMGQISLLITLIMVTSMALANRKSFLSGFLLALLFLKPQFIVFIPILYFWQTDSVKRQKFLMGIVFGTIVFWLINVGLYGPKLLSDYPKFVIKSESISYGTSPEQNYNLVSIFWRITNNARISNTIADLVSLTMYVLTIIWYQKKARNFDYLAGIFMLLPLINVHTMLPDLVVYLIPMGLMLKHFLEKRIKLLQFLVFFILCWILPWLGLYKLQYIAVVGLAAVAGALVFKYGF